MTKYSDKKKNRADCAWPYGCQRTGNFLRTYQGKLNWFCRGHSELIDFQQQNKPPIKDPSKEERR